VLLRKLMVAFPRGLGTGSFAVIKAPLSQQFRTFRPKAPFHAGAVGIAI
jgi:hypothetical protein